MDAPYLSSTFGRMRYGRGWQVARAVIAALGLLLLVLLLAQRAWLAAAVCAAALYSAGNAFRRNARRDREQRGG